MALDVYSDWLGIPEGPRPPDHYVLLRLVQFEDDVEKIRKNYKKLNAHVRKYATGQYSVQSQDLLNELAKAMLCLTDLERKKDYDRGLGREFTEETAAFGRLRMETQLIKEGRISDSQLKEARNFADKTGIELRDALVQLQFVEPAIAAQALATELGVSFVDLSDLHPDESVLDRVPKGTVKQHSILPLFIDDHWLLVACTHLIELDLEEELRLRLEVPVRPVLADPKAISQAIAKYYAPGMRNEVDAPVLPGKATAKKTPTKNAPAVLKAPAGPLTREQKQERAKLRKQIGIIIFCWSFLLAYLLDYYVITPNSAGLFDPVSIALYTVIPGIAAVIAWLQMQRR